MKFKKIRLRNFKPYYKSLDEFVEITLYDDNRKDKKFRKPSYFYLIQGKRSKWF